MYATCSLLREENDDIIEAFLRERPDYARLHCGEILRRQGIELDTGECFRVNPHVHAMDGFFAAVLQRAK